MAHIAAVLTVQKKKKTNTESILRMIFRGRGREPAESRGPSHVQTLSIANRKLKL